MGRWQEESWITLGVFFGERTCSMILTRYKSSKVSERDLPSLETGRWEHACGSYTIAQQQVCKYLFLFVCVQSTKNCGASFRIISSIRVCSPSKISVKKRYSWLKTLIFSPCWSLSSLIWSILTLFNEKTPYLALAGEIVKHRLRSSSWNYVCLLPFRC